jgi:uncharacterized membrane protein
MSNNETKLGMAPSVAGLLCNTPCCIGFVFSIVAAVVEKENRFVRFHAFQSLLLHGAWLVVGIAIQIAGIVAGMVMGALAALAWLFSLVVAVAFLGAQIFLMIKANNNEEFRLPVIGDMAASWL